MSPSNVLKFPGGQNNGFTLKVFAMIFYGFLAYMMTYGTGMSEGGFMILIVLGLLYNFVLRHGVRNSDYLQRNKVLLIILLFVFVLAFQWNALLMVLLAGLYWLMIGRSGKEAPYFLRFHLLTGLILNFFILMPFLLLMSFLSLILAILNVAHLTMVAAPLGSFMTSLAMFFPFVFFGVALWLSISALLGRTPYVFLVTANIRPWV